MKPKYKICLCQGCIDDLNEYYPYLVPQKDLEIIEVSIEDCDNNNLDNYNDRLSERNPEWFDECGQLVL